jgi:type I restriction enzyme R subunit
MNEFQVTNQVSMSAKRNNRYDVTILINGLPSGADRTQAPRC